MRLSFTSLVLTALSIGSVAADIAVNADVYLTATSNKKLLGSYWPAYYSEVQPAEEFPWKQNDLAYYFLTITNKNGTFSIGPGQFEKDIKTFTKSAKKNKVKSLFSIGGWDGSQYMSDVVATDKNRKKFAKEIKDFMKKYSFDGVDLDWEYVNGEGIGCNSVRPKDAANLLSFLKTLRKEIGKNALITAAVATTPFNGPDGSPLEDVSEFAKYFDYLNLMTYDISGSWSATTAPLAPLKTCKADASAHSAVENWTAAGFPASKMFVGIPSYATSWTTASSKLAYADGSKLYQNFTSIPKGNSEDSNNTTDSCGVTSTSYSGAWQYYQLIKEGILRSDGKKGLNGFKRYFDECTQTPFLFNSKTKYFISYNDAQSAQAFAEYTHEAGLAGAFIFDSAGYKGASNVYKAIQKGLACKSK